MDRAEAVQIIKRIQNGEGVARDTYPVEWRGRVARSVWNDGVFTLGIEYGYILALTHVFGIADLTELAEGEK